MRVLLIEDDKLTAGMLSRVLENEGMICEEAHTGQAGLLACKIQRETLNNKDGAYDIILLDMVLPDLDGYYLIQAIRDIGCKTPIIGLSGLKSVEDKTRCFDLGADDYISKPFVKAELLARIRAVTRRVHGNATSTVKVGDLHIDLIKKCIKTTHGRIIDLTEKEYLMVELMARRIGTVISKETFINNLYGDVERPAEKIIDVFACKIRAKILDAVGNWNQYIHTAWGRGYILEYRDNSSKSNLKITNSEIEHSKNNAIMKHKHVA